MSIIVYSSDLGFERDYDLLVKRWFDDELRKACKIALLKWSLESK